MSGRVIQSGEAVDVGPDDLLVRSIDGRLAVEAPAGDRFVSDGVCGPPRRCPPSRARGAGPPRPRRAAGGARLTNLAEAATPTTIVFGTDGWRAKIADDYTFENVRRCADGVARYVVDRGEQAKGVVVAYDRRFASEHFAAAAAEVLLAHDIPVAFAVHAVPTQMSSYEVLQRGAAAGIVITASHNPWTDNGFKVKAPTGAAAGPEILTTIEAQIARNGGTAIERRPFADAEAAGLVERFDPFPGYETFLRRSLDLDALKAADITRPRRPDVRRGRGLDPAAAGRRQDPGHGDPPGAQPLLRRHQPGADPAPHRRGARDPREGRLRPGPAARRRRGPRRRGRREGHVHPPAPGHRPADVLPRGAPRPAPSRSSSASTTPRRRPGSASATGSRRTRRRSASSSSGRR